MNNVFAEFELPTEYGVGCDIHDAGTPPCANVTRCDATAPLSECASNWCELPWCYIDRNNCRLQHQSGSYQKERSYSCEFKPKIGPSVALFFDFSSTHPSKC